MKWCVLELDEVVMKRMPEPSICIITMKSNPVWLDLKSGQMRCTMMEAQWMWVQCCCSVTHKLKLHTIECL